MAAAEDSVALSTQTWISVRQRKLHYFPSYTSEFIKKIFWIFFSRLVNIYYCLECSQIPKRFSLLRLRTQRQIVITGILKGRGESDIILFHLKPCFSGLNENASMGSCMCMLCLHFIEWAFYLSLPPTVNKDISAQLLTQHHVFLLPWSLPWWL